MPSYIIIFQNKAREISFQVIVTVMTLFKADQKTKDWGNVLWKQLSWKWSGRLPQSHWPTSSFWHLSSASSLVLHDTQIFLFLTFLYFGPRHSTNHLFLSSLHWRNCSLFTSPCFHSRWWGQQHEDSKGILSESTGHHHPIFTLIYNLFTKLSTKIQIYSTVIAKTQISSQRENGEQCFQDGHHAMKFKTQG